MFTEDQFGNRVGDELVSLSDNTESARTEKDRNGNGYFYASNYTYSDFETDGDFAATATQPVDQRILATWDAPGTNANGSPASPKTDSYTINWYDGSIDNGTVTIESSPEGTVMTGSAVTETVTALDSAGNPIVGAGVVFTRQGPGDEETQTFTSTTDSNGEASYTFFGTTDGTANITATVNDGDASQDGHRPGGLRGRDHRRRRSRYDITATLTGKNKARGNDVLRVYHLAGGGGGVERQLLPPLPGPSARAGRHRHDQRQRQGGDVHRRPERSQVLAIPRGRAQEPAQPR